MVPFYALTRSVQPKAVIGGIFDRFFRISRNDRPVVADNVVSSLAANYVGLHVLVKFGDSMLNSCRIIPLFTGRNRFTHIGLFRKRFGAWLNSRLSSAATICSQPEEACEDIWNHFKFRASVDQSINSNNLVSIVSEKMSSGIFCDGRGVGSGDAIKLKRRILAKQDCLNSHFSHSILQSYGKCRLLVISTSVVTRQDRDQNTIALSNCEQDAYICTITST